MGFLMQELLETDCVEVDREPSKSSWKRFKRMKMGQSAWSKEMKSGRGVFWIGMRKSIQAR
jgi:hypothetical protein